MDNATHQRTILTANGWDPVDKHIHLRIVMWRNFDDRTQGREFILQHGDKVELLERKERVVKVRTLDGKHTGYLTYWWFTEYQQEAFEDPAIIEALKANQP